VIVEDFVWEAVRVLARSLGRLALVRRLEAMLASASPPLALVAFAVPVLLVEPAKLLGFALLAQGRFLPGVAVLAAAYGLGTVLLVRVWSVCRPALLTYRTIAWSVDRLAWFRSAIHAWLEGIALWHRFRALQIELLGAIRTVVRAFRDAVYRK
jgi:hypothetical protein